MQPQFSRRRMIGISAAAAGISLLPLGARLAAEDGIVTWRGTALGAVAAMQIHHPDRAAAEHLISRSIAEVRRLEALFSLYRDDSALVALNKHGAHASPATELVELLSACRHYSEMTGGAFDATVQPLWNFYAGYFSRGDASPAGPDERALADVLARIGYDGVLVNQDRVALARQGMQITLNGIAQGYITDRVVDLLRAAGITQTLVDIGETRCLGTHPDGRAWQIGIADPDEPARVGEMISIVNRAVATSGGYGFRFDPDGTFNHLFDPKTGRSANLYSSVTVIAATATAADALSTAFTNMTIEDIDAVLRRLPGGQVHLICADGSKKALGV